MRVLIDWVAYLHRVPLLWLLRKLVLLRAALRWASAAMLRTVSTSCCLLRVTACCVHCSVSRSFTLPRSPASTHSLSSSAASSTNTPQSYELRCCSTPLCATKPHEGWGGGAVELGGWGARKYGPTRAAKERASDSFDCHSAQPTQCRATRGGGRQYASSE